MLRSPPAPPNETARIVGATEVQAALPWDALIDGLGRGLSLGGTAPLRHHHEIERASGASNTLLLMPAWREGGMLGVKMVTVAPGNGAMGLPAINALYILSDATTGVLRAVIDGGELTARRTAAVSALAARHLARRDARRLLIVGSGRLCRNIAQSHATVRDLDEIVVWGRSGAAAEKAAHDIADLTGRRPRVATDLAREVGSADIVTCVTLAAEPVVLGAWLRPGTHLDLIGGFTPRMRETDDDAIRRARVYVDAMEGAPREAGDIVQPLAAGVLRQEDIAGDLFGLCRGDVPGRADAAEITLFKSAGHALQDLVVAEMVAQAIPATPDRGHLPPGGRRA